MIYLLRVILDHISSYPIELKKGVNIAFSKPPGRLPYIPYIGTCMKRQLLYDLNVLDHEAEGVKGFRIPYTIPPHGLTYKKSTTSNSK